MPWLTWRSVISGLIYIASIYYHHWCGALAEGSRFSDFPHDLDTWDHDKLKGTTSDAERTWTTSDLEPAFSVLNLEQMLDFFERLEAGLPITVLAFGDSITADGGGCFHRDRLVQRISRFHCS